MSKVAVLAARLGITYVPAHNHTKEEYSVSLYKRGEMLGEISVSEVSGEIMSDTLPEDPEFNVISGYIRAQLERFRNPYLPEVLSELPN